MTFLPPQASSNPLTFSYRVSYLEIYNETMFDLLSTLPESMSAAAQSPGLNVVEDENGVYVKGLTCHLAQTEEDALNLLFEVSIFFNIFFYVILFLFYFFFF